MELKNANLNGGNVIIKNLNPTTLLKNIEN